MPTDGQCQSANNQCSNRFCEAHKNAIWNKNIKANMENIGCYQDGICIRTKNEIELRKKTERKIKKCGNENKQKITCTGKYNS